MGKSKKVSRKESDVALNIFTFCFISLIVCIVICAICFISLIVQGDPLSYALTTRTYKMFDWSLKLGPVFFFFTVVAACGADDECDKKKKSKKKKR